VANNASEKSTFLFIATAAMRTGDFGEQQCALPIGEALG